MTREFALAVADKCEWTTVSFVTPEGEPYSVPVSAVRVGESLYFHSAREGRKAECIAACPKRLVKRVPASAKVYIACSNCLRGGKEVRAMCSKGCVGCGLCAKVCPEHAIELKDNLPVIDYGKCVGCGLCASKCPAKCIKSCD